MLSNYKLYFDNLPSLEKRCQSAGIGVEPFLCAGVSHVVVLNKMNLCPNILSKITSLKAKVITARAVNKWLNDYNIIRRRNSPPPKTTAKEPVLPAEKPMMTHRADLVVSDSEKIYKPQFLQKVDVPFHPDFACNGSPWAMNMYPDQRTKTTTLNQQHQPSRTKSRTTTLQQSRKIFCENCRVSVTDLDEHVATLQHRRYAENNKNFAMLDAVIGDMTLENLLSQCNKKRKIL